MAALERSPLPASENRAPRRVTAPGERRARLFAAVSAGILLFVCRAPGSHGSPSTAAFLAVRSSEMQTMKTGVVAAAVAVSMAGGARAQDAVQWRVEDGGNGHWYAVIAAATAETGANEAIGIGAHLATIVDASENEFVRLRFVSVGGSPWGYIGLVQTRGQIAPTSGWSWMDGTPLDFSVWTDHDDQYPTGAPDDTPCGQAPWGIENDEANAAVMQTDGRWDDVEWDVPICHPFPIATVAIIEWSADCNADGIVDFGQIRAGELADADGNNIPDCCEDGSPCAPCTADVIEDGAVNGVDLAAVINAWGTDGGKLPRADIDRNGIVDGADLAILLSGWGPCD
jgi:hypothetical protein